MKISHPYLEPLPAGDPPRPAELDANINDEAQDDGQRMATYVSKMLHIRKMIRALMASGDIPPNSRPYSALQQIERDTHFYSVIIIACLCNNIRIMLFVCIIKTSWFVWI
jgi:hypothetical protein